MLQSELEKAHQEIKEKKYFPPNEIEGLVREFVQQNGERYEINPEELEAIVKTIPSKGISRISSISLRRWLTNDSRSLLSHEVSQFTREKRLEEVERFNMGQYYIPPPNYLNALYNFIAEKLGYFSA